MSVTSIKETNGRPGSPFAMVSMSRPFTVPYAISSARSSAHSGALPAPPFQEAMQGPTPFGPSKSGDAPVEKSAITTGGVFVRSNTTTDALPLPTNSVFPSGVTTSPFGPERGFTPFARDAQHCAPGNPPKEPFGPKPGNALPKFAKKGAFLQPNRVSPLPGLVKLTLPRPVTIDGIPCGSLTESSCGPQHGLKLFPAFATWLIPPIVFTAKLFFASVTTTSSPMRSDVYTFC